MRLGVVGVRGHNHLVFDALPSLPGTRVVGVSSGGEDDPGALVEAARACGFDAPVYGDYLALLDRARPEGVAIAGPFERHAGMAAEALRRGAHVFVEKPMALDMASLDALEAEYRRGKAKLMAMQPSRYQAAFAAAKALVDAGRIGKVKLVQAQKSYPLGRRAAYYTRRASYGGTLLWVGAHAVDWITLFAGSDFRSVWACQSTADNDGHGELEVTAQAQFTMGDGTLAQISLDYLRPRGASPRADDRVRVAGTGGVVEVRGGKVFLLDGAGEREIPAPPVERGIFADFVRDIRGGGPALLSAETSFAVTRACLYAQQSADTGQTVAMP